MLTRLLLILTLSCFLFPVSYAADWPGWRGLRGDGSTPETDFPTKWDETKGVRWKAAIPGTGHSSPVVSNGRVFLTTCIDAEQKRVLLCLDRTDGRVVWQRDVLTAPLEKKHKLNSHASSTAAADGERVYVTFLDQPRMRVYCYDFAGNKVWEKSPGEFHSVHGFCTSPVLYGGLVILNGDQDAKQVGQAYIVALDKITGEERWRIDRPNKLRSYCPPVIGEVNVVCATWSSARIIFSNADSRSCAKGAPPRNDSMLRLK